ncbi:MAG: hypothetical protein ACRYFR_20640 [Janthinobacterium lividum]
MPSKLRFCVLAALAACAWASCKHDVDVTPQCYAGVILRDHCVDGTLIQVDSQFPIGKPLPAAWQADSLGGNNVIAAANHPSGILGKRGQRIYFTFQANTEAPAPRYCFVNVAPLAVPHRVLSNVSTAPCAPTAP